MRTPPFRAAVTSIRNLFQSRRLGIFREKVLPNASRGDWVMFLLALSGVLFCAWYLLSHPKPGTLSEVAKLADGTKRKFREFMAPGLWYGSMGHLLIWIPMLLLIRYLPKGKGASFALRSRTNFILPTLSRQRFLIILSVIVIAAGVVRWQRMDLSYWGDEGWAVTRYGHGVYRPTDRSKPQETMRFYPSQWDQAFFDDTTGGNHYLFTIAQRLTLDLWRAVTGKPREAFDETVSRLPSFVAGLACLFLIAGMLRWWGQSRAGLWAAFFLAIHPMHLRYASEARGYALMLCYLLAAIWFAALALDSGRWRWWISFGLAEFLTFYSWKGVYYGLAILNLAILLMICFGKLKVSRTESIRAREIAIGRWVAVSLMVGGMLIHMVLPCLLQAQEAMKIGGGGPMDIAWLKNTLSQIFTGSLWFTDPENKAIVGGRRLLNAYPVAFWCGVIFYGSLFVYGSVRLVRSSPHLALFSLALILSCIGGALDFKYRLHMEWLSWYSFFVLPTIATVLAYGVVSLMQVSSKRFPKWGGAAFGTFAAAAFILMATPTTAYMMSNPFEANREAFEITRGKYEALGNKAPSNIYTIYLWRHIDLYDPRADTHIRDAAALRARIEEVKKAHGELFVVMGERGLSELLSGDMVAMLSDPKLFTHMKTYPSAVTALTLFVYHYTGPK